MRTTGIPIPRSGSLADHRLVTGSANIYISAGQRPFEEDRMTVLFEEVGYKTLSVPVVLEHGC